MESSLLQPSIPIERHPFLHPSFLHISNSPSIQRQKGRSPSVSISGRAVVRRRLQRSKIGFSKSFPFSRHDIAPNVGIGRLADSGRSPTTPRAAARNNILSYLGISPIQRPHRLVHVFSNNTPQTSIIGASPTRPKTAISRRPFLRTGKYSFEAAGV